MQLHDHVSIAVGNSAPGQVARSICIVSCTPRTSATASMDRQIVLIRHGDDPADDRVVTYFRSRNIEPRIVRPFNGDRLGVLDDRVAGSVVFGGPFNVFDTDKHPFLLEEHRWIERCIEQHVPLLGICQGAQSIAYTLGAVCGPRAGEPHEFGYYPVRSTPAGLRWFPERLMVAQAHSHAFELPDGAELLAAGDVFPHQAMRYGDNVFAFQFHPEVTRTGFGRWQDADWAPYGKPGAQTREEQDALARAHDGKQHSWFMNFLDTLFGRTLDAMPRESEAGGER